MCTYERPEEKWPWFFDGSPAYHEVLRSPKPVVIPPMDPGDVVEGKDGPLTRVAIDLNIRVRGNQTYAGLEDADGPVAVGDDIEVYERETRLAGPATVVEVDTVKRLVDLAVDWSALRRITWHGPPREPSKCTSPTFEDED